MFRLIPITVLPLLVACSTWPDIPSSAASETGPWPELQPFGQIGQPSADPERDAANQDVEARAASLRARANVLRRPVPDDDAMERLRQSLAR